MSAPLGVGIVGANAQRGWALEAHLPALQASPDYEVRAVSARDPQRARAAADRFGAAHAFDDARALVAADGIDLVVVTVKVPDHREIVMAALAAGKAVFCEWPLGRDLAEAGELAAFAEQKGIPTLIGLQTRFSPAIRYLRQLVGDGHFGELLCTSIVGSAAAFGGQVEAANDYILDAASGATLLSIPAGHAVDALCHVLGELDGVSATMVTRFAHYVRIEDRAVLPSATPDQLAFSGTLENGALASVHFRGGVSKGADFIWEINGTKGDAILDIANGRLSSPGLSIRVAHGPEPLADVVVPDEFAPPAGVDPDSEAANVAGLYAQFARDRRDGTRLAPDFAAAMRRHRLIDAIETAHRTGMRQSVG